MSISINVYTLESRYAISDFRHFAQYDQNLPSSPSDNIHILMISVVQPYATPTIQIFNLVVILVVISVPSPRVCFHVNVVPIFGVSEGISKSVLIERHFISKVNLFYV